MQIARRPPLSPIASSLDYLIKSLFKGKADVNPRYSRAGARALKDLGTVAFWCLTEMMPTGREGDTFKDQSGWFCSAASPLQRFDEQAPIEFCRALLTEMVLSVGRAVRLHAQRTKHECLLTGFDGEILVEAVVTHAAAVGE